jgi:ADP-heptose:LPS heptosyltransferase
LKVLVIRFSSIGDIVLTFPVLRCIKEQLPNCELHFATKKAFSELISASGSIDKCHLLDNSLSVLISQLKLENFDAVIDLHNNFRSRSICFRLNVKMTSHFLKLNVWKWILVKFKLNYLPDKHIVDRYFEAVREIGVSNDRKNNQFLLKKELDIRNAINLEEGGYVAVAIGAQYETKQIPNSKLQEILSKIDLPIVLLGGEMDINKANELIKILPNHNVINTCGKYTLLESASILKKSKLLLTGDTGLMHIASCFEIPIFAVWGNTTPLFGMSAYKPQDKSSIVNFELKNISCRPCSKIGFHKCPKGHFNCMIEQDSDAISRAINRK